MTNDDLTQKILLIVISSILNLLYRLKNIKSTTKLFLHSIFLYLNTNPFILTPPPITFIRQGSSDRKAHKSETDAMFRDQAYGSLPVPIEELMETDISLPRNPILAKLFRAVGLAENVGFGFDKMINGWTQYNTKQ